MIVRELWSRKDEDDLARFGAAVEAGDLLAALHAVEGADEADAASDRLLLAEWGRRIAQKLVRRDATRAVDRVRAMAAVLAGELGFRGDDDDYYDPRNCFLHSVLTRRRGMPILMSIVWMEVGRRAGLDVHGIGLPGHFIVRVENQVFADAFGGGTVLSDAECRRKVDEISGGSLEWRDEYLTETTSDQILERVLQNLAGSFRRADDDAGRYRAATFLTVLRPDSAQRLLERAELAEELGIRDLAARTYEELVERFPDSSEAQEAADKLSDGGGPPAN